MSVLVSSSDVKTSVSLVVNQAIKMSFQLAVAGQGAVSASAVVEGSHDNQGWINISTFNASGTDYAADGGTLETYWPYLRARITAVTGTATVYGV